MNFSRLLAAGKSLVGMKDTNSPYRLCNANFLPKFDSPKNPFASSKTTVPNAKGQVQPAPLASAGQTLDVSEPPKAVSAAASTLQTDSLFEMPAKPAPMPIPVEESPMDPEQQIPITMTAKAANPEPAPKKKNPRPPTAGPAAKRASGEHAMPPGVLADLMKKVNPFLYLTGHAANKLRPRNALEPVQAELSLDNVKVIRNELTDSDLEVIAPTPAKKIPKAAKAEAGAKQESLAEANGSMFDQLASEIFSGAQTQARG